MANPTTADGAPIGVIPLHCVGSKFKYSILEGFSFVFWLIWHISSQVYVQNLIGFPIDILWFSYLIPITE